MILNKEFQKDEELEFNVYGFKVKGLFKFEKTNDKPNGTIILNRDNDDFLLKKLIERGWESSIHANCLINNLGVNLDGLIIGLEGYFDNLTVNFETPEVGYYSDSWGGSIDIKSQDDLDRFVNIIDNFIIIKKNNKI